MPAGRNFKAACVPHALVNPFVVDAGKFSLVTEGDDDPARQFAAVMPAKSQTLVLIIERKFPLTVEIEPLVTNQLWPWILGAGNVW